MLHKLFIFAILLCAFASCQAFSNSYDEFETFDAITLDVPSSGPDTAKEKQKSQQQSTGSKQATVSVKKGAEVKSSTKRKGVADQGSSGPDECNTLGGSCKINFGARKSNSAAKRNAPKKSTPKNNTQRPVASPRRSAPQKRTTATPRNTSQRPVATPRRRTQSRGTSQVRRNYVSKAAVDPSSDVRNRASPRRGAKSNQVRQYARNTKTNRAKRNGRKASSLVLTVYKSNGRPIKFNLAINNNGSRRQRRGGRNRSSRSNRGRRQRRGSRLARRNGSQGECQWSARRNRGGNTRRQRGTRQTRRNRRHQGRGTARTSRQNWNSRN